MILSRVALGNPVGKTVKTMDRGGAVPARERMVGDCVNLIISVKIVETVEARAIFPLRPVLVLVDQRRLSESAFPVEYDKKNTSSGRGILEKDRVQNPTADRCHRDQGTQRTGTRDRPHKYGRVVHSRLARYPSFEAPRDAWK